MADALLIVDVQNDFTSGGALEVPDGDAVIPPLDRLAARFDDVFATRDWHPPDHDSFDEQGGPWPVHCVRGERGAELHPDLDRDRLDDVIDKGRERGAPGYSAFEDTDLELMLRERDVDRVVIGGLATDVCVRSTALAAAELGFEVELAADAVRGVDPEASQSTLEELREAGVKITSSDELLAE